jgi:hypothetical protein
MGGSRTKKGTRKGKQQMKKTVVVSCYKPENTWGQDFDGHEYMIKTMRQDKYMEFWGQFTGVGEQLDAITPPWDGLIRRMTDLVSCIHMKDYTHTRQCCLNNCCLEVRESPLGGVGVFATKDIQQGQAITMYPPNYIRVTNPNNSNECSFMDANTQETLPQREMDSISNRLLDYKMGEDGIILYGDPEFNEEWSMLGHMINDFSYDGTFDYKWDKANVLYCKLGHVVSVKDIKVGEELSLHYGVSYWFEGGVRHPESRHHIHKVS